MFNFFIRSKKKLFQFSCLPQESCPKNMKDFPIIKVSNLIDMQTKIRAIWNGTIKDIHIENWQSTDHPKGWKESYVVTATFEDVNTSIGLCNFYEQ